VFSVGGGDDDDMPSTNENCNSVSKHTLANCSRKSDGGEKPPTPEPVTTPPETPPSRQSTIIIVSYPVINTTDNHTD